MRILITIHHQVDADSGAPGVTLRLAEEYRRRGHEVSVLDFGRLLPPGLSEQAKMIAFPWMVAAWLSRAGARSPIDVIDTSTGDAWVFRTARRVMAAPLRRALLVARSHGLEHSLDRWQRAYVRTDGEPLSWKYHIYHGGYRLWEVARSLRTADSTLFLNEDDRTFAIDHLGVAPEGARLVRNGIPQALIGLPRPEPGTQLRRIAIMGSYLPVKGIKYTVSALSEWLPRHPGWHVAFLGTGVGASRVLGDFEPTLHSRITVVERYANHELPRLLAGCEVHLFPTLSEGMPVVLLEAMACGLAPVVSAIPGTLTVAKDAHNAIVVPPATPDAIVAALDRLAADPEELARIRGNAWETAQSYGWQDVAAEQLAIYAESIGRLRRASR